MIRFVEKINYSTFNALQQIHCWSRDLAACVTWPTPCSQNKQTPTFRASKMPPPWLMIRGCPAVLAQKFQQSQQLQFSVASALCAKRWKEKSVPAYTSRFGLVKLLKWFLRALFQVFKSSKRGGWYESPPPWQDWPNVSFLILSFLFPQTNKNWPGMTWNLTSWKLKSTADISGAAVDLLEQLNHFVMAPVRWNFTIKQQS